jgi:hypothetical protein
MAADLPRLPRRRRYEPRGLERKPFDPDPPDLEAQMRLKPTGRLFTGSEKANQRNESIPVAKKPQ